MTLDQGKDPLQSAAEQQYAPLVVPSGPYQVDQLLQLLSSRETDVVAFAGKPSVGGFVKVGNGGVFTREEFKVYMAPKEPKYDPREINEFFDSLFLQDGLVVRFGEINEAEYADIRPTQYGRALKGARLHMEQSQGTVRFTTRIECAIAYADSQLLQKFGLEQGRSDMSHPDEVRNFDVTGSVNAILFPHQVFAEEASKLDQGGASHRLTEGLVTIRDIRALQRGRVPFSSDTSFLARVSRRFGVRIPGDL